MNMPSTQLSGGAVPKTIHDLQLEIQVCFYIHVRLYHTSISLNIYTK